MTQLAEPGRLSLKVAHKGISRMRITVFFGIGSKVWREGIQGSHPSLEDGVEQKGKGLWSQRDLGSGSYSAITSCVHLGPARVCPEGCCGH